MIEKPTNPKIYKPQDGSCVLDLDGRDVKGSKIYDRSGNPNHGDITGAVIKPMNYGLPVLDLDGVDDIINCGNDPSLNLMENFSIEMVVKLKSVAQPRILFCRGLSDIDGYYFLTRNVNCFGFKVNQNGASQEQLTVTNVVVADKWIHLVSVKSGSSVKIYINGVDKTGTPVALTNPVSSTKDFYIGCYNDESLNINTEFAKGCVLSRVISVAEISQRFQDIRHLYGI